MSANAVRPESRPEPGAAARGERSGRPRLVGDARVASILETQRLIAAEVDDLHGIMQLVSERAQTIVGASGAIVNLVENDTVRTHAGTGIGLVLVGNVRAISASISRVAIQSGESVLITDCRSDPRIDQSARARVGDESQICVPLVRGQAVIGTLNVLCTDRVEPLDEQDRETLEMLSVVLSAAVSHAAALAAREAEARALARLSALFEGASLGIMYLDRGGVIQEANPAVAELLGVDVASLIGDELAAHLHADDTDRLRTGLATLHTEVVDIEVRCVSGTGVTRWCHLRAAPERDPDGDARGVAAMIEDVTEHRRAQEELVRQAELNQHMALHDPLTGLPNRVLFGERIEQAIRHARRNGDQLAVVLMDLDRFKEVNDSLGHPAGDELLVAVAERVRGAIRDSDTLARLGGDEFGLLLPELRSMADVEPVLARVRSALEVPITVHTLPLAVEASIGVAVWPAHGENAQILIQHADVAMYEAKRESSGARFYDESSHQHDIGRLTLVGELRGAMERSELLLHYQPKAILANCEVRSVEALVRWQHPERGLIYPDAFIPIAQETSLIGPLTLHVLDLALRQARRWQELGLELAVAVNLSVRNLLDRDFPRRLEAILERCEVQSRLLELEVTESAMLANPKRAKLVLGELSALGVRLSIDDFGTGYSSLSYLRELPVDEIKIDRSFVMRMEEEGADVAIVRSTIDLGRNLGLDVVAEGVETQEIWDHLLQLGCQTAQGYFLSRPVEPDALTAWMRARSTALRSSPDV
ncbi:MAG TPA: EAL domain-containing protein [Solirubrobacteraceae bacterium]|nr:EAL domain-containing protein [Solirubrobacteraceae bacterium]